MQLKAAAVLVFAGLAALAYFAGVYYPGFDNAVAAMARGFRTPALDGLMSYITWLGNWQVKFPVVVLAAGALIWMSRGREAAIIFACAIGGEAVVGIVKAWLKRPRPPAPYPISFPPSYGFPSDHAFSAVAVYGLIFYFAYRLCEERATRMWAVSAGIILAGMLGLSRIYLGVHWTTDVLGGYALGAAWTVLLVRIFGHFSPSSRVSLCSGSR